MFIHFINEYKQKNLTYVSFINVSFIFRIFGLVFIHFIYVLKFKGDAISEPLLWIRRCTDMYVNMYMYVNMQIR